MSKKKVEGPMSPGGRAVAAANIFRGAKEALKDWGPPKRVPVDFRYDAINPTFLHWMAKIGSYAAQKYGAWEQYTGARLVGEKSPVNHIFDHLRKYQLDEKYDHFDGDPRWHLVAVAYNAMMEFYCYSRWGHVRHPLTMDDPRHG
jgi:hypothetical protein